MHLITDRKKLVVVLLLAGVCIVVFAGVSGIYLSLQQSIQLKRWERVQAELKENTKENYKALAAAQEKAAAEKKKLAAQNPITVPESKPLRGTQTLHLILVKPAAVPTEELQLLLRTFMSTDASSQGSLQYTTTYLQKQAQYYGVTDLDIAVTISELHTLEKITTVGDMMNFWEKDAFGIIKLQDEFESILERETISEDDPVIFLYFDPFSPSSATADRFYDNQAFRSFADDNQNRAYVNIYSTKPSFAARANEIIIHELLHLYGATDKYLESKIGCAQAGWEQLPYPYTAFMSQSADIMCGYLKEKNGNIRRADFTEDEVVINRITADEIGW